MSGIRGQNNQPAEYVVVVQLLDRERGRDRERLYRALGRDRTEVDAAIDGLERVGVLTIAGRTIRASPALVCLERLGLIAL